MSPQDFGPEQLKQTIFDILNGSTGYDVFLYYTQIRHNGENDFLLQLYKLYTIYFHQFFFLQFDNILYLIQFQ